MHERIYQLMASGLTAGDAIDKMQAERAPLPQIEKDQA
jgi:uncharacterized protein YoaH (UPF0181 family)